MKTKKINIWLTLLCLFLFVFSTALANETTKIDSLKSLSKGNTEAEDLVDIYINLSDLYGYFDGDSSLEYAKAALELSQKINYKYGEGTALFLISYIYDQQGEWIPAIANLEQAIEIFTTTNDTLSLISCYHNLGVLYSYGADQVKALQYIIKSKVLCEESNQTHVLSEAYSNIGWYYEYLKEYRRSLLYYEKALEIDIETGNIDNQSLTQTSIGFCYLKLHQPDEALRHLNEALKLVPQIEDKQREVEVTLGFIYYYLEIEDLSSAKNYIDKITTKANEEEFAKLAVEINFVLGKYYVKKKSFKTAITYLDKAIEQSIKLEKFDYLSDYYNEKGEAYVGLRQFEKAYQMTAQGKEAYERLKPDEITQALGEFEHEEIVRSERKKLLLEQQLASEKMKSDQFRFRVKAVFAIAFLVILLLVLSFFFFIRKKHTDELKANYNTISSQKLMLENNLVKLAEDEKKLKKLNATKDKFFSIIAHDLKNPFNVLIGISDMLKNEKDAKDSEDFDLLIEGMYQAATSGYELLENLLEWSRAQTGSMKFEPQSFFIHKIFETNKELYFEIAKTKDITIEISKKKTMVFADYDMVNFIVRNLLNNSIKFSNPNSKIELNTYQKDKMLVVTVKDNGIGMSPEMVENLFKIEMSVQREGTSNEKGTGLGLILCHEFIKINGGEIWVESEKDKGSSFYFSLPLSIS
ncbi:tetratricopeptide repeat-containing sensor histidine kinase [uncultured Draconibacterium sp.]|uniref:ATP-binding protein n=1 Tax=uncultured Draconibacterium sp. TaxID=1573823 RepID=UPI002AA93D45|nr:tetratricopeptide repeat-containing sensor histidine kinase [uncultured Draconibacterium sp.]